MKGDEDNNNNAETFNDMDEDDDDIDEFDGDPMYEGRPALHIHLEEEIMEDTNSEEVCGNSGGEES